MRTSQQRDAMTRLGTLLVVVLALMLSGPTFAASSSKGSGGSKGSSARGSSGSKPVHVKGYTKKDGTTVAAHERKAPKTRTTAPTTAASRNTHGRIRRRV